MVLNENPEGKSPEQTSDICSRRELAMWLSGGIATACFLCFLAGYSSRPHGMAADTATRLFWIAIPTLLFNMMVIQLGEPYRKGLGWISSLIPLIGVASAAIGISAFVYSTDHVAGVVSASMIVMLVVLVSKARDHAKKIDAKQSNRLRLTDKAA